MSLIDDMRAQLSQFRETDDKFGLVHARISRLTYKFETPGPNMQTVREITLPHNEYDIPARLYTPHGADEVGPLHVYFHGGGFVTCNLDSHDGICRRIALSSGHRVLSVDYRLAPQYAFPAATDDAERSLVWAMSQSGDAYGIDGTQLTIGGDSAGGNLAAYLAQKYRQDLSAQVLFYPLMQLSEKRPHIVGWQDRLELGAVALTYIEKSYVCGADVHDTRLSPMFESNLRGLPPTYILTCGLDPLREEGRAYADRLRLSGVSVQYHHEKSMPHGFLNFTRAFPPGRKIPVDVGEFLRRQMLQKDSHA
ncbi:alpha/beta hydrolase [Robiginitomaculum antarcticum]|uniref:alpha/beta hydrolase n=1 Tax=Robiginitomaculum antarcticum TaxID=437507 RepID=UPI000368679A|nr:alpha/beta hydrolase [Robiginitomaculum antarcticum]